MAVEDQLADLTAQVSALAVTATNIVNRTQGAADLADSATAAISAAATAVAANKAASDADAAATAADRTAVHSDAVAASTAAATATANMNNAAAFATAAAAAQAQAQTIANNSAASATAAAAAQAATQTIANNAAATATLAASTLVDINTAAAAVASDKTAVHADRVAADADAAATAADRTAVASDKTAAHNDRVAADADAASTATDRAAVSADKDAAHADRVAADSAATAAAASAATASGEADAATAQALIATTQAGNAAGSATTATTQASIAATQAGVATAQAGTATTKASDASTFAAAALASYNNANALLSSVSASAVIAQQAAASAVAVSNLSILAAAQRAVALMTDASASWIDDTTKWTDPGARARMLTSSLVRETLNTATRGARADYPSRALWTARASGSGSAVVTISDMDDPACPMWAVFLGTSSNWLPVGSASTINSISGINGKVYLATAGAGLAEIDLISDVFTSYRNGAVYRDVSGAANRNSGNGTSWATISTSGIAHNTVNSVAVSVLPLTQPNPLRFGLPNPTIAVGTNGGVSVIRADGFVSNSGATTATMVAFDDRGNLWSDNNQSFIGIASPAAYMTTGWAYTGVASFTAAQLGSGAGLLRKIVSCGPGMMAVAHTTGFATIKLDPTNPANSLCRIKTTTYDTGWMVLGKTVLAMTESSQGLTTYSGTPVVDDAMSYADNTALAAGGFGTGAGITPNGSDVTFQYSGGQVGLNKLVTGLTIGETYQLLPTFSSLIGSPTSSDLQARAGTTTGNGSMGILNVGAPPVGSEFVALTFVAAATSAYVGITAQVTGKGATLDRMRIRQVARDVSGSGNYPVPVGSPTRSQVASGTDCAGYSNLGGANYFETGLAPYDPASGDVGYMGWVYVQNSGNSVLFSRLYYNGSAFSGAGEELILQGGTTLAFYASAAFGVAQDSVTYSLASYVGQWVHVAAQLRAGYLELFVNGQRVARAARAQSNGSMTNASATLRIGQRQDNWTSVLQTGAIIRAQLFGFTPDQIAFMYADEKGRFVANAKELLSGANVQAVAFDPDTNQLAASNSTGGTDVFAGPGFSVRVANQKSTTGANKIAGSAIIDQIGAGTNATLAKASISGPSKWGDATAFSITENNVTGYHSARICAAAVTLAAGQTYLAVPVLVGSRSWAAIGSTGGAGPLGYFNAGTGANGSTLAGGASFVAPIAMGGGWYLFQIGFTASAGAYGPLVYTATGDNVASIVGDNGASGAALYIGKPFIKQGASPITLAEYSDGLSANDNHKAVAFAGGDLVVATGAGVDAFLGVKPGLRETAGGVGAPRRAFYDPTRSVTTWNTANATPVNVPLFIVPEGKSFDFTVRASAKSPDGSYTNKLKWSVIEGHAIRPTGGVVYAKGSTPTLIDPASSTAGISIGFDTTNNLVYATLTGLAAALDWNLACEIVWTNIQQTA